MNFLNLPQLEEVRGHVGSEVEPPVSGANLDEVPGAAVDADVIQLQTDDLIGLADDEGGAGQLWLGCGESEVAIGGQHVQASWRQKQTLADETSQKPGYSSLV